jgi:SAM-dependent methyltransferase
MTSFEDHFSRISQRYVQYRPQYPAEFFQYLSGLTPGRELAWDFGTGNGQAAVKLADFFRRVVATDPSRQQIARAIPHARVAYYLEKAEQSSLVTGSCDLITGGLAVHWLDLNRFYPEVRRVLKPGGVLAVWSYHLPVIDPGVDRVLKEYYEQVLAGYWPERFHHVAGRYQNLPFPFAELQAPPFWMQAEWDFDQLAGFITSWSATQRYREAQGFYPLEVIWQELSAAWGEPGQVRNIRWQMYMRVGRVE